MHKYPVNSKQFSVVHFLNQNIRDFHTLRAHLSPKLRAVPSAFASTRCCKMRGGLHPGCNSLIFALHFSRGAPVFHVPPQPFVAVLSKKTAQLPSCWTSAHSLDHMDFHTLSAYLSPMLHALPFSFANTLDCKILRDSHQGCDSLIFDVLIAVLFYVDGPSQRTAAVPHKFQQLCLSLQIFIFNFHYLFLYPVHDT